MKLALVKPDHLGDIVLSTPAVRALARRYPDLVFFGASSFQWLFKALFPEVRTGVLNAPHLTRDHSPEARREFRRAAVSLREFDVAIVLRRDRVFNPEVFGVWAPNSLFIGDRHDVHQTRLERDALLDFIETYDAEEEFFGGVRPAAPAQPQRIAFSIGSGMAHKKWSPLRWAELGLALRDAGKHVTVLAGPREVEEARVVARASGFDPAADVIVGSSDLGAFDRSVADLDLVIAADGGTAHLAARTRPILSVFGSSPHRRYCPIGADNRVITLNLPCSPCPGFDLSTVNGCVTHECLYGVAPQHVLAALAQPKRHPGAHRMVAAPGWPDAHLFYGLSAA